jgi:hypothetical protein
MCSSFSLLSFLVAIPQSSSYIYYPKKNKNKNKNKTNQNNKLSGSTVFPAKSISINFFEFSLVNKKPQVPRTDHYPFPFLGYPLVYFSFDVTPKVFLHILSTFLPNFPHSFSIPLLQHEYGFTHPISHFVPGNVLFLGQPDFAPTGAKLTI